MRKTDIPAKQSDREINRVQMYIYLLALLSFLISFLEGFREATPEKLIIHLCVTLGLLCLVPGCAKRPLLISVSSFLLLIGLWGTFFIRGDDQTTWLGLKLLAVVIMFFAFRAAWTAERRLRMVRRRMNNQ